MKTLKLGKQPKKEDPKGRTLMLSKYLTPVLAPPPAQYDNLAVVYGKLKNNNPQRLFPMDGNDVYGDCVCAGAAHATTMYDGLTGRKKVPTRCSVIRLYRKLSGGQDSGLVMLDFLKFWRKNGAFSEKIVAFAEIDPHNHDHVKQAVRMFGGVFLGFRVQTQAIDDFNSRRPWTPGQLTDGGHAVYLTSYDEKMLTLLTWGNTQQGTWDWWDQTCDEAYAIIPVDAMNPAFNPGFDFNTLLIDLEAVRG